MREKEVTKMDFELSTMIDMAVMIMKYSREQLVEMLSAVDVDALLEDMKKHGATRDELLNMAMAFNDFTESDKSHWLKKDEPRN
jgi:hypothetical protein